MSTLGVLGLIVFASFLVEAATGFGSMVVALTLGALWFQVPELLGWLIPVNMVLSAYLVVRGWGAVQWRFLATRMVPLMALGLGAGTLVAARASEASWLKPLFGVFVMAVAAWQLSSALKPAQQVSSLPGPVRVGALLLAGVIHGIFATGGPLAVFVSARELPDKAAFRATLSMLWLVLNALVMPRLVLDGQVTAATLGTSGLMLVPLALGIAAGEWVHHRLAEAKFRVAVAGLLLAAGAVLVVNALRAPTPLAPVSAGQVGAQAPCCSRPSTAALTLRDAVTGLRGGRHQGEKPARAHVVQETCQRWQVSRTTCPSRAKTSHQRHVAPRAAGLLDSSRAFSPIDPASPSSPTS